MDIKKTYNIKNVKFQIIFLIFYLFVIHKSGSIEFFTNST
jgi:hypothetical protein